MDYQILALDLDGTLTNSKKEISAPTLEALIEIQHAVSQTQDQHQRCQRHGPDGEYRSDALGQEEGNYGQTEANSRQQNDQVADGLHLFHVTFLLYLFYDSIIAERLTFFFTARLHSLTFLTTKQLHLSYKKAANVTFGLRRGFALELELFFWYNSICYYRVKMGEY